MVLALFSVLPVSASTITVTNGNDSGPGSLRQAIADANPGDTIDFSLTYPATITLTSGQLVINKNLTITGPGASSLAISGNFASRVFLINSGTTINISGLTIEKGNSLFNVGGGIFNNGGILALTNTIVSGNSTNTSGGGIRNTSGALALTNTTVSGNSANQGGGIFNYDGGTLTITNSTVSGNFGGSSGGGITNHTSSTMTLTNSTVSGNSARGGGINLEQRSTATVTNSTISGNSAPNSQGGGIFNWDSTLTLTNSTVSGNSANQGGGGIFNYNGTLTLKNTIVANSPSGGNCAQAGIATSYGHNLSTDETCSGFFTSTGDLNSMPAGLDPSGLQNNGGPTATIALMPGSVAIDAVSVNNCTEVDGVTSILTDQRGISRPQGTGCDIGAYELATDSPPVIISVSGPTGPLVIGTLVTVTADFTDADGTDTHTCIITWGDGSPNSHFNATLEPAGIYPGRCEATHYYDAAGVYTVTATVTDNRGASDTETFQYVVVYDPNGGFVTGGGWIQSPPSAFVANQAFTGKANFGFVSKYLRGANIPSGETQFEFKTANLNFHSTSYEWLVVAGARAQFKGSGTINGTGDYAFLLTAIDGQRPGGGGTDKFRIKIINKSTGDVIYDNQMGKDDNGNDATELGGGNIVIHP